MNKVGTSVVIVLLPVITGLGSVLWARLVRTSPEVAMLGNVLGYSLVALITYTLRSRGWTQFPTSYGSDPYFYFVLSAFVILNALTSLSWMIGMNGSSLGITAALEVSYPLFILIFSIWLLGGTRMNIYHYVGAAIVMVGSAIVVYGNSKLPQL